MPDREVIFDVAAFAIIASIAAHGLTDTLGARWLASRVGSGREDEGGHLGPAGLD